MAAAHTDTSGQDWEALLSVLSRTPHHFLQPTPDLHLQTVASLKALLDPLAAHVADAQTARRDENRRKRKRAHLDGGEDAVLQLRQVYTKGLAVRQVWEQARRILDAASDEVAREIAARIEQPQSGVHPPSQPEDQTEEQSLDEDDLDGLEDDISDDEALDGEDLDEEEDIEDLEDIDDIEQDDSGSDPDTELAASRTYIQDPNHLNDGFFSIDDFNRQTQFLEQQDARGEDDNPSDEDEVDWDADPLALPSFASKASKVARTQTDGDKDSSDEEDDGPTFGNADLNADDSDEDMIDPDDDLGEGLPGNDNTNEIRYADFFAPPPKKASRTKRMRALPKTQPSRQAESNPDEDDLSRAMADVRRDLLESEDEASDEEDLSGSDLDRPSTKNLSTHERQQLKIAAEIRRLEAANVSKKDWTLSGEARGADRPINSLLEEDLEFERVGKPVPVVTAEVTEEIEQLIKRRILAREFDEVIRRRPDAIGDANETRRGRVELDDTKPTAGLGEIYEQEHLKSTDPGYVDKRSAATKKAHEEIGRLWKEVSAQLDLLSNLNFKPRRAQAEIKTVEDKPTISMEDARPSGAGGEESMLAPQEVYRPGEDQTKTDQGVIVRKGGSSAAREEMTREEKLRRRRREKARIKKANQSHGPATSTSSAPGETKRGGGKKAKHAEKDDILAQLRKGNVKVVGNKGELQDLDGKHRQKQRDAAVAVNGAGNLKL